MAGYIENEFGKTLLGFHMGTKPWQLVNIEEVAMVQLDGDELEHVYRNFNNIPMNVKRRVNVWRGDMAKFIIENWE